MEWSGLEEKYCLELLSWKVDVEWCGLVLSESSSPATPHHSDVDWETLAASLSLTGSQPFSTSPSPLSATYGPVKVTGVVLLLGLGGYLCYKLYKVWLYQQYQSSSSSIGDSSAPPPSSSFAEGTPAFSYHHMSNPPASINDLLNVKTQYFGPLHMNNEDNYSEGETTQYHDSSSFVEGTGSESHCRPRERRRHYRLTSPPSLGTRRGWLLHKIQSLAPGPATQACNGAEDKCNRQSPKCDSNSTGTSSTGSSPLSHPHLHSLSRDLSFDSLLFSHNHREGSIDSISSELSLEMPSFAEQAAESVTVARLDQLQEEIDQLKSNCQLMDEEFETVKGNRNLPGMSELMEASEVKDQQELTVEDIVKRQSAKACFKGLYSLTTINRSVSMDLSLEDDPGSTSSHFNLTQLAEEEHLPSLEWDEEYDQGQQNSWADEPGSTDMSTQVPHGASSPNLSSKLDTSGYGSKLDLSASLTGSQFSCSESPTSPGEEFCNAMSPGFVRSMSCESMTNSGDSDMDSPTVDNAAYRLANIGPRVDVMSYALQEWTGNTPTAKTIIRGYKEVRDTLGYQFLRQIRGDNYCALRSAIFQTLAQGLSVPSSTAAMDRLSEGQDFCGQWYRLWRFNGLPYTGTNLLRGMEICLQSLDNIHALLQSSQRSVEERENTLQHLLNTDPTLDLHIMEAVKLHMMVAALNLHIAYSKGLDIPLFSILLFARDTSEVPLDFMNNHLVKVGDSGGLDQVEMCLLGYTLRVSLKVVRLSEQGTQQFICYYPDDNVGVWPEVTLVAEDDRHYNILTM